MTITSHLFEAYLKCPTKCWLRSQGEAGEENAYAHWVWTQNEAYRSEGTKRLLEDMPQYERVIAPSAPRNPKSAKWRLAVDLLAQTQDLESRLHAVERVPSEGRGKPAQFIPIRFVFTNKLSKDDKLLLAFDALVFSEVLGREVSLGRIIHGDDHATLKVKTSGLMGEARNRVEQIRALLSSSSPPDLVLNRHCGECEFQTRCRQKAIEKDDLSLLANMTEKERKKYHSKGIFTVTQLSYTFRPRRRPKRMRDKWERYHHSLKALAIREKKIHIVGSPELKIEGTPVYLDVEGLPDRDSYYLIGMRIGDGESASQHSLWADTVEDEGKIWREFLRILETIEKPVLIHYGAYEVGFLKRMHERYDEPTDGSVAKEAIQASLNLLSVIFAQLYFPTFSNGLKDLGYCLGFKWSENRPSGPKAIVWRCSWEQTRDPTLKAKLTTYNSEDCAVLERICSVIRDDILTQLADSRAVLGLPEIVRAESIKDQRLQKWREFKSPFAEFESFARAAHWHYQRDRLHLQSQQTLVRRTKERGKGLKNPRVYREVVSRISPICPGCHKKKRSQHLVKTRHRYELFTGRSSLKVRLVRYVFHTHFCRRCNLTFGEDARFKDLHKFGWSLVAFLIYQIVGLNIPQRRVAESFTRIFGTPLDDSTLYRLKRHAADYYRESWGEIVKRIAHGNLAHADETRIHFRKCSGYVWVLTNLSEVAYIFSPSREAELPRQVLADFRGVLVSDFYTAYDSLDCKHQRCLIHLIRDLNDEVLDHPYDEELKAIVRSFGETLKPIIETVNQRGLKRRFLNKFKPSTARFFAQLRRMPLTTEAALKCRDRFERNKDQLFTFLEHDGVPWNNNNAEHAVKALARLRTIIAGISTQKGLEEYLILLSIAQTCDYMGADLLDFLRSGEKDVHAFATSRRKRRGKHPNERCCPDGAITAEERRSLELSHPFSADEFGGGRPNAASTACE